MTNEQYNPWTVASWDSFYFLNCPECVYRTREKSSFQCHAEQNHPKSKSFFNSEEFRQMDNFNAGTTGYIDSFTDYKGMPEEFLKTRNIIDALNQQAALNPIKIEPEEFKQEFYEDDHFDQNDYPIDTKPLDPKDFLAVQVKKQRKKRGTKGIKIVNCEFCDAKFDRPKRLEKHMKVIHPLEEYKPPVETVKTKKETTFKCKTCSKEFNDRDELKLHRKDEHNVRTQTRIHKCTFCSKEFKGINELWNHNKDEHNSPFIKCEECDQTFSDPKKIYMHRSWFHNKNDNTPIICDECGKTCGNQRKLDAHKKSHIVLPCQFCGKFISSLNMKNHLDIMHSDADKSVPSFICEHCTFATTQKRYLYQHKKYSKCQEKFDENSQIYVAYNCKLCYEKFPASKFSENMYLKHYKSIHGCLPPEFKDKERYPCTQCSEIFFNPTSRNQHVSNKHGTGKRSSKEYTCEKCDFTCTGPRIYATHCLEAHNEIVSRFEKIKCKSCVESFRAVSFYIAHHREVHGSLPPEHIGKELFVCDQCPFVTLTKRSLRYHLIIVHKDGNYKAQKKPTPKQCSYCEKVFKNPGNLKEHILTKHENRRDHHCDECERSFGTPAFLKTHKLNVHNRVRCEECGKEHYNAFELKRHKANVHGIKPKGVHQCKLCPLFFNAQKSLEKHILSKHLAH